MNTLDIHIDDSNLNPRAFRISDSSTYDVLEVKNAIVEITPPGAVGPSIFMVNPQFSLVINASLLHLNSSGLKIIPSLPDGVYTVKYSVAPNAATVTSFYYFRNTKQVNSYLSLLTEVISNESKYKRKYYYELINKLWQYKQYIDAAKYMAEDRHDLDKARDMYDTMTSSLDKFTSQC